MSKQGRKRSTAVKETAAQTDVGPGATTATKPTKTGWQRLPPWAWVLVFFLPLALSEYMFYMGGRTASMVMFPIAWVGFWITIWYRFRAQRDD